MTNSFTGDGFDAALRVSSKAYAPEATEDMSAEGSTPLPQSREFSGHGGDARLGGAEGIWKFLQERLRFGVPRQRDGSSSSFVLATSIRGPSSQMFRYP